MRYSTLAEVYEELEKTSKRLEKTRIVSKLLKKASDEELQMVMLLLEGRIYPAWDRREAGVATQMMLKAISHAVGTGINDVQAEWKMTGDLGKVSENLISKKKQATLRREELDVAKVFSNLRRLNEISGNGSVDRKIQLIAELLSSASPNEARYITRTVLQQMRVGIGAGTLRDAIVHAFIEEPNQNRRIAEQVQEAYDLTSDFGEVAKAIKSGGIKGIESIKLSIGNPIKVMLALKVDTIEEGFEKAGRPMQAEYKMDGFRVQIHKKDEDITVFTRRLENVTKQFPEIAEYAKKHVNGEEFILDAEAAGYDPKSKKYLPFQSISQRIKRKYDIERMATQFPVEVNVFDVIWHNGKNMISEPFRNRRKLIERIVEDRERKIRPSKKIVTDNDKEIEEFFREAKEMGNEGLMFKNLDAPYKPGARVGHMLKYKKTMENLDLAIVKAEWGEGKRSMWLSSYTIACRKGNKLLEVGKVSTGLKEKPEEGLSFDEMTKMLKPLIIGEEGKTAIVKPEIVIEVGYEEIQKSPTYESGFALRFPRIITMRQDKGIEDISSMEMVEQYYNEQKKTKK
ncbi:ATP-dependent DNA ligase [Candidatus Woesearchaeota archaeon]|nr:ATP-dependent DNA ligase [Candidatus Woesearchaeota archaeon]